MYMHTYMYVKFYFLPFIDIYIIYVCKILFFYFINFARSSPKLTLFHSLNIQKFSLNKYPLFSSFLPNHQGLFV